MAHTVCLGFEVFKAAKMWIVVVWVTPCTLACGYQYFGETYRLSPEDGSDKFLLNVDNYVQDYAPSEVRRPH
jgi:hypothetical protein